MVISNVPSQKRIGSDLDMDMVKHMVGPSQSQWTWNEFSFRVFVDILQICTSLLNILLPWMGLPFD